MNGPFQQSSRIVPALLAALLMAACDAAWDQPSPEVVALRASMARLNDLEDRVFDLVDSEGGSGRLVRVGSDQALQALEQEARKANLVGCADEARHALVATLEEINNGGAEGWPRARRYRDLAEVCEASLSG